MSTAPAARVKRFRLAGYHCAALPAIESAIHTRFLAAPEDHVRAGRVLRETTTRVTGRVAWEGVGPVLVKFHRIERLRERLISLVRTGRARAEWEAARHLHGMGAPVPEPLAVGERRSLRMLDAAFYAARYLEVLEPVSEALSAQPDAMRQALLERLIVLIRGMHDRGFDHRDLHTGNVLMGPGPGDRCRLAITDLHRCTWGRPVSSASRRRGLAQWLHSLTSYMDADARWHAVDRYLNGEPSGTWHRDVERRIARMERVRLKSRGKRCFKNSTVYTSDVGSGQGWRRRDLTLERLANALAAHDAARDPGHPAFVKRSSKGLVTRHGDVVVKERLADGALAKFKDALHARRHASGYHNAHCLGVRGVDTARPLAFVREDGRTYSLFEDLSDLPRLDHLAHDLFASDRTAGRRLLDASATWLRALHRSGVYHGDLKGVNVLVGEENGAYRFHLIDTDRVRFFDDEVDHRRRIKNLSQLAASIARCVTRSDRLRWYRRYADDWRPREEEKRVAREVAAQLAQKILVVDEPIE